MDCRYIDDGKIDGPGDTNILGDGLENYGVGQPVALSMDVGQPSRQIWLYYYRSKGEWGQRGVYLAKGWDGFQFEPEVRTNLINLPEIRYYPGKFEGHDGIFVAIGGLNSTGYFNYSYDGVNWKHDFSDKFVILKKDNDGNTLRLEDYSFELVNDDMCISPGHTGIVSDKFGYLTNMNVITLFSGEGYVGSVADVNPACSYSEVEATSRGSTWGIWGQWGKFVEGGGNSCEVAVGNISELIDWYGVYRNGTYDSRVDFDCNGSVNLNDLSEWYGAYRD